MLHLHRIFWSICRLQKGPQELPKSIILLLAVIFFGMIADTVATSILLPKLSNVDIVKTIIIYNLLLLTAIYLLLYLVGYKERGLQTITAIAGSGLYISLILLPALLMMNSVEQQVKSFILLILIDNVWRIAVNAHIFRHALSVSLLMAMILSVSYMLFGILLADYLLPSQTP